MENNKDNNKDNNAIILLNMGGPNNLNNVEPFLYNLFSDRAIINLPGIIRLPLAKFLSLTREKKAKAIYGKLGGKSPILDETIKQQEAIKNNLSQFSNVKIHICMRYAEPKAKQLCKQLVKDNINRILLLPLYPQYSSTTTNSSINDFIEQINHILPNNNAIIKAICCYPINESFIKAHVDLLKEAIQKLNNEKNFRILFSAHSLPVKIIEAGDPYQWQIEQSVKYIIQYLDIENVDFKITYQSKVGPLEWLSPATDTEIIKAGSENKHLIIVPISFVSEHSETLVELDIDYKLLADSYNIQYIRVPSLTINKFYISTLTKIIEEFLNDKEINISTSRYLNKRICPDKFKLCPNDCKKNDKL